MSHLVKLSLLASCSFLAVSCNVENQDTRSPDKTSRSGAGNYLDDPTLKDETVSHDQPASTGFLGSEGKCGQTALANFCCMVENCMEYHPDSPDIERLCRDITPGVHPTTLCKAAGELCESIPEAPGTADPKDPLGSIKDCLPAMVLVSWDGSITGMHWVTIVKIENGRVYFNHWGRQDSLPFDEFIKRWGFTNCDPNEQNTIIKGMKCGQYTYICSEPEACEEEGVMQR